MTDNRTNEPTEAQVEAAAKVLLRDYQSEYDGGEVSEFLDLARAVLEAADAVVTEEQIAMAVAGMRFSDKECQEERPCGEVVPDHAGDIARVVVSLFRGGAK